MLPDRWYAAPWSPIVERAPTGSAVDAVEPQIRELLAEFPTMPATVIVAYTSHNDRAVSVIRGANFSSLTGPGTSDL